MTSPLDLLLEQVEDAQLRKQLTEQFDGLRKKTAYGRLNFEEQADEAIRIPKARVTRKTTVQPLNEPGARVDDVRRITDGVATIARRGEEPRDVPVAELVVARQLGDPVYMGLTPLGELRQGGDKPAHLVLQGENYHALQTLLYTHEGKVDLIYIDPPYNTGAGDWIYNDRYVGDTDEYRHSKWLAFMDKRLRLAKRLLKDTGVIIVAIDDNEHHRLRILLDDVFGERNFISNVVWQGGRKNDSRFVSNGADYMLIYAKSVDSLTAAKVQWREPRGTTELIAAAAADAWNQSGHDQAEATRLMKKWIASLPEDHPAKVNNRFYDFDADGRVYRKKDISWPGGGGPRYDVLHPTTGLPVRVPSRGWIYSDPERMQQDIDAGLIHWGKDHTEFINRKTYLDDSDAVVPTSVFERKRTSAGNTLASVLGSRDFPFPKDVDVIARWVNIATANNPDAVILDFFGGTGTTTEAVMRLNAQDGGRRQSILVTNNELAQKTAKALAKASFGPGDPEWEAEGVFEKVTRPRIETVVTAVRRDGSSLSDPVFDESGRRVASGIPGAKPLEENVVFARLDYLDRTNVELGAQFREVALLLYAQAGATGRVITERPERFEVADSYAILTDVAYRRDFVDAVHAAEGIRHAYIVEDDAAQYQGVAMLLDDSIVTHQLYEDYLVNFTINTGAAL